MNQRTEQFQARGVSSNCELFSPALQQSYLKRTPAGSSLNLKVNLILGITASLCMFPIWVPRALSAAGASAPGLAAVLQAVELDRQQIDYYDLGKGRPLMLIHGAGCDATDWRDVVAPLAERYRLIVPDGRVHPIDPWRLWLLLDHLEIDRVAIVGHSKGGHKAKEMYRLRPGRVQAMVVIDDEGIGGMVVASDLPNSLCSPHVVEMHRKNDSELANLNPPRLGDYPSERNIARLKSYFRTANMTPEELARGRPTVVVQPMRRPSLARPAPIKETEKFIQCPLLVMNSGYGKVEAAYPPERTPGWVGKPIQAQRYEFLVVRDSGHWIWLDQPEIFLKELLRFLARSYPEENAPAR